MKNRPVSGTRSKRARAVLVAVLAFLLVDGLFFRLLVWRLPNETAWESEPLYSFEYRFRAAERARVTSPVPRVLILGSSLAAYGFLPDVVSSRLGERAARTDPVGPGPAGDQEHDPRVASAAEVILLGRQGLHWVEMRALVDRFLALRPDIIVVPTNMVDFRLERPAVLGLWPELDATESGRVERALAALARDEYGRPPLRLHAPWQTLRCCSQHLDGDGRAEALLASLVAAFRFRSVWRTPIARFLSNRLGRERSYLFYAGVSVGEDGVTHRGRTARRFLLPVTARLWERGLEVEAPAQMFDGRAPVRLTVRLWRGRPAHVPKLCPDKSPKRVEVVNLRRGWQKISLRAWAEPGDLLCAEVDRLWWSDVEGDRLGLRLARNTGVGPQTNLDKRRPLRREDDLYLRSSDDEYRRSYSERMMRFERPAARYLHDLHQTRLRLRDRRFSDRLPGPQALAAFRKRVLEAGVRLLILNAPENPLSRGLYDGSAWYAGYLSFLGGSGSQDSYRFVDARSLFRMQLFYDTHHLSYYGAQEFSRWLADELPPNWLQAKRASCLTDPAGEPVLSGLCNRNPFRNP